MHLPVKGDSDPNREDDPGYIAPLIGQGDYADTCNRRKRFYWHTTGP
jgi:hypothetical protein